jgi:hypothetical protein
VHVQVVTYRIADIGDAEFIEANEEFAAMMSAVPGLVAKVWLKEPGTNTYGGVYLWRDRESCERFLASDVWQSVVNDETLADLDSRDFAVMEELTKATQPGIELF